MDCRESHKGSVKIRKGSVKTPTGSAKTHMDCGETHKGFRKTHTGDAEILTDRATIRRHRSVILAGPSPILADCSLLRGSRLTTAAAYPSLQPGFALTLMPFSTFCRFRTICCRVSEIFPNRKV